MLDRYTARALMDLGQLSPEEYLRLYRNELRAQREKAESAITLSHAIRISISPRHASRTNPICTDP